MENQMNGGQLWLWRNDTLKESGHRGWYITRKLGNDSFNEKGNIIAWCPSRNGEPQTFPVAVHVPYNRANKVKGIEVLSYVAFLESEVSESRKVVDHMAAAMAAHEHDDDASMQVHFEQAHEESATLREMFEVARDELDA